MLNRAIKVLLFLAIVTYATGLFAQTVNPIYRFADIVQDPAAVTRITLERIGYFADYNGVTQTMQPVNRTTDTNGTYRFTNVVSGAAYRATLSGPLGTTVITNGYPYGLTGDVEASTYRGLLVGAQFFAFLQATNFPVVFAGNSTVTITTNITNGVTFYGITSQGGSNVTGGTNTVATTNGATVAINQRFDGTNIFTGTNTFTKPIFPASIGIYGTPIADIFATNIDFENGTLSLNAGSRIQFEGSYFWMPDDATWEFVIAGSGDVMHLGELGLSILNPVGPGGNINWQGVASGNGSGLTNLTSAAVTNFNLSGDLRWQKGSSTLTNWSGVATNLVPYLSGANTFSGVQSLTNNQNAISGNKQTNTSLQANTVMVTDSKDGQASSVTTDTEVAFVHGVTSAIQTQLNSKTTGDSSGISGDPVFFSAANGITDLFPASSQSVGDFMQVVTGPAWQSGHNGSALVGLVPSALTGSGTVPASAVAGGAYTLGATTVTNGLTLSGGTSQVSSVTVTSTNGVLIRAITLGLTNQITDRLTNSANGKQVQWTTNGDLSLGQTTATHLLMAGADNYVTNVTLGANLTLTGTTLAASGGGGSSVTFDPNQFSAQPAGTNIPSGAPLTNINHFAELQFTNAGATNAHWFTGSNGVTAATIYGSTNGGLHMVYSTTGNRIDGTNGTVAAQLDVTVGRQFNGNGAGITNIPLSGISGLNTNGSTRTNIIDGGVYVNNTGSDILVMANVWYAVGASGIGDEALEIIGRATNHSSSSFATSIATNMLSGVVTNGGSFTFTNRSSGTGTAGLIPGLSGSWTPLNAVTGSGGGSGSTPTGTGFPLIIGGVQQGAASLNGAGLTNSSRTILNFGGTTAVAMNTSAGAEYMIIGVSQSAVGASIAGLNGIFRAPVSGYLTNLWIDNTTGIGVGTNVSIRVFTNGVASNMAISVNGAGTSTHFGVSNLVDSIIVPAGCSLNLSFSNNTAGGLNPANQQWMGNIQFIQ